ncbi:NAD-dependent epimerase/dehydratase family protein [Streptomyces sp. NPDC101490]|uniref:NAD-dependent epimerase/dehydratase family protein n=1 Tax=Streptomyces sp. NPDC101490 TaxID=3366143 RepID=UPI003827DFE2
MTALIIGASGFLGTELVRLASILRHTTAATFNSRLGSARGTSWHHLDLRDPSHLDGLLDSLAPSVVINASSGNADWTVTADGSVRLAQATALRGISLAGSAIERPIVRRLAGVSFESALVVVDVRPQSRVQSS